MSVDLLKARKGDTVKFRCGGEATLHAVDLSDRDQCAMKDRCIVAFISQRNGGSSYTHVAYMPDGRWLHNLAGPETPFDIVAIEPGPFDWSTVKPGTAFRISGYVSVYRYVGPSFDKNYVVFKEHGGGYGEWRMDLELTRAPEHDIEIKTPQGVKP